MSTDFEPASVKPDISFSDFDKVDIRVGQILDVQDIPKSRELVKLIVDFGDHQREILAGIKNERDDPSQLINVKTLFLLNIQPKKMMGEQSHGMLFDIGYSDGILPTLTVLERDVPNGTRAG